MSENLDLIVKERAEKWLSDSYDEETRKKVKQLIDNDPKELTESFYKDALSDDAPHYQHCSPATSYRESGCTKTA